MSEELYDKLQRFEELCDRVRRFGRLFESRLGQDHINNVIDLVDHDEPEMAFEDICIYISDYNIKIKKEEFEEAEKILKLASNGITSYKTYDNVDFLKRLIIDSD